MLVELKQAEIEDREILSHLLELYNYEFSQYDNIDVNKFGLYGFEYLDYYLCEKDKWAYFIMVDGKLEGFILVRAGSELEDRKADFAIAEFFVMYKYRHFGVGKLAFFKILELHKGLCELKLHPKNIASEFFWERVINEYTGGNYELIKAYPGTEFLDGSLADVYFFHTRD